MMISMTSDVISFSASISACGKGGQWQRASFLFDDMRRAVMLVDVISFSAAISAREKDGQWQRAFTVFHDIHY